MNRTTHPVREEEVMALLDSELPAERRAFVSGHLEHCSECANLARQFRSVSRGLAAWTPGPCALRFEDVGLPEHGGRRSAGFALPFDFPRRWGLAAIASVLILAGVISGSFLLGTRLWTVQEKASKQATRLDLAPYSRELPSGVAGGGGGGQGDRLDRQPQSDQLSGIVAANSSGAAGDSDGLLHEPRDYARDNSSANGAIHSQSPGDEIAGPMIARTVSLTIVVKDFAATRSNVDAILAQHGGHSAQLDVSSRENAARSLAASLRIPAPELTSAMADLRALGRVENESQSSEEVTRQHADLVARLKNARETEQRFRAILERRTGNVAEVLQVEEGIARVRGEIEQMEAEQKNLDHRVELVAVELRVLEEYQAQLNPPAASIATRFHNALVEGYRNASDTLLGIVLFIVEYALTLLIWAVLLALPVLGLWVRFRRILATV